MKKLLILALLISQSILAQTLSKKEARQILQKAWTATLTNDSIAFAKLWSLNDSESKKHRRPHSENEVYADFRAVREWLDTAITRKLTIENIGLEDDTLQGTDVKYWIMAWFKYNAHYSKSFGFYLASHDGRWVVRDNTSASQIKR